MDLQPRCHHPHPAQRPPPTIHINGEKVDLAQAEADAKALTEVRAHLKDLRRRFLNGELEQTPTSLGNALNRAVELVCHDEIPQY